MHRNRLVAHRGYPSRYPENTLVGIEAALRAGASRLEVDVQLTADGEPVLFHDRDLRRVCAVPGAMHELALADVRRLRASEPGRFGTAFRDVPVATLAELGALLEDWPETETFVEIKRVSVERFGAETAAAAVAGRLAGVLDRCVVISFVADALRAARGRGCRRVGLIVDSWRETSSPETSALAPEDVLCNVRKLPWRGGLAVAGARVAVYDVVDPARAERLFRRGADLVETFAIGEMLEHFA